MIQISRLGWIAKSNARNDSRWWWRLLLQQIMLWFIYLMSCNYLFSCMLTIELQRLRDELRLLGGSPRLIILIQNVDDRPLLLMNTLLDSRSLVLFNAWNNVLPISQIILYLNLLIVDLRDLLLKLIKWCRCAVHLNFTFLLLNFKRWIINRCPL